MITRFDQPLPAGGDGMLRRENRNCQEAEEEDGEPHKDSGEWI